MADQILDQHPTGDLRELRRELEEIRRSQTSLRTQLKTWRYLFTGVVAAVAIVGFGGTGNAAGGGAAPSLVSRVMRLESAMYGLSPVPAGTTDRITTVNNSLNTEISVRSALASRLTSDESIITTHEKKLAPFSTTFRNHTDASGGFEVCLDNANLHIRNGLGGTETTNGLGNLFLGYNETVGTEDQSGSHNFVVGERHSFPSYGGVVFGYSNTVGVLNGAGFSTVLGGAFNQAIGNYSVIAGGTSNTASGEDSIVAGGRQNIASGYISAVSGGFFNTASGEDSAVGGGGANTASGKYSSVSGGTQNHADGEDSSVSGGYLNVAAAYISSVSGGFSNTTNGWVSSIAGGVGNSTGIPGADPNNTTTGGTYAHVCGGENNAAQAQKCTILGGFGRQLNTLQGTLP